jgi:hypothetical protein
MFATLFNEIHQGVAVRQLSMAATWMNPFTRWHPTARQAGTE